MSTQQDVRVTAPTEAIAVLASAFAMGVLLHAASSSFCSGLYGHFKTLLLHRRRLALLIFYLSVVLYSLGQFVVLLLLGDVQCQVGVTLTTIAEQLARISSMGIILWKIYDGSAYKFEKNGLLAVFGTRCILGVVMVGFARKEFVPVCFMKPGVYGPGVGQIVLDGIVVFYALVRVPLMFRLFKDQGQATTRSLKEGGKSQGYGMFLIILAYGAWWAGSFPHTLGFGNLAIRVFPLVLTLLLLINILRLFPTLAFSVPATKSITLRRLDSAIPPQGSSRTGNGAISSPNGSPVLTPRLGDLESNKKGSRSDAATNGSVSSTGPSVEMNSGFVFGNIIGAPSITKASTLQGGWALTKDQEERGRKKSLSAKSVASTKGEKKSTQRGRSLTSGPSIISGPSLISGPIPPVPNRLTNKMPIGLPSGVRIKTIDLKSAAKLEQQRIDDDFERMEKRKEQSVEEEDAALAAVDVRTMERTTSVKRKAVGELTRNTSKSSTITAKSVRKSTTEAPIQSITGTEAETQNTPSLSTEGNSCNSPDITSIPVPQLKVATLDMDIPPAKLYPDLEDNGYRSETVLLANQIVYDDPALVKSLISPENYISINHSFKDGDSLALTTSCSTGSSSSGLFKRSNSSRSSSRNSSRNSSRSPSRNLNARPASINSLHVTKLDDQPPRILTPIMMRKMSSSLSRNRPRSLWPGSPSQELPPRRVTLHRKSKSNPLNGPPMAPPPDVPLPPLPSQRSVEVAIKSAPLVSTHGGEIVRDEYMRESIMLDRENVVSSWAPIDLSSLLGLNTDAAPTSPPVREEEGSSSSTDETTKGVTNSSDIIPSSPSQTMQKSLQRLGSIKRIDSLKRTGSVKEQYATDIRTSGISDEGYATAKAWVRNVRTASSTTQVPLLVSINKRQRSGTMNSTISVRSELSDASVSISEIVTLEEQEWSPAQDEPIEVLPAEAMRMSSSTSSSLNGRSELVVQYDYQYFEDDDDENGRSEKTQSDVEDMIESGDEEDMNENYDSPREEEFSIHDHSSDSGSDIFDNVAIESDYYHHSGYEGDFQVEPSASSSAAHGKLSKKIDEILDDIAIHNSPKLRHFTLGDQIPTFSESRRKYGTRRRPPPSPIRWLMQSKRREPEVEKSRPEKIQDRLTLLTTRKSDQLDMEELMRKFPAGMVENNTKQRESGTTAGRDSLLESLEREMNVQERVWKGHRQEFRASQVSYVDMNMDMNMDMDEEEEVSPLTKVPASNRSSRQSQTAGWQRHYHPHHQQQIDHRADSRISHLVVPVEDHLILKSNRPSPPTTTTTEYTTEYTEETHYDSHPRHQNKTWNPTTTTTMHIQMTPNMVIQSPSSASSEATEFEMDSDYEVEEIAVGRSPTEGTSAEYEYEYEYESVSAFNFEAGFGLGLEFEPLQATVYCPTPIEMPSAGSSAISVDVELPWVNSDEEGEEEMEEEEMGEEEEGEKEEKFCATSPVDYLWSMKQSSSKSASTGYKGLLWTIYTTRSQRVVTPSSQLSTPALSIKPKPRKATGNDTPKLESRNLWTRKDSRSVMSPNMSASTYELWGAAIMNTKVPSSVHVISMDSRRNFLWNPDYSNKQQHALGLDTILCSVPFAVEITESLRARTLTRENLQVNTATTTITSSHLWQVLNTTPSQISKPKLWTSSTFITEGLWPEGKVVQLKSPAVVGLWRCAQKKDMVVQGGWDEGCVFQASRREGRKRFFEGSLNMRNVSGPLWHIGSTSNYASATGLWSARVSTTKRVPVQEYAKVSSLNEEKETNNEQQQNDDQGPCAVGFSLARGGGGSLWKRRGQQGEIMPRKNLRLELTIGVGQPKRKTRRMLGVPEMDDHISKIVNASGGSSLWAAHAQENGQRPNWMDKLRRSSLIKEEEAVGNKTNITFVITSPPEAITVYDDEKQDAEDDVSPTGSSNYIGGKNNMRAAIETMPVNSAEHEFGLVLLPNSTIADEDMFWRDRDVTNSAELGTICSGESGSERGKSALVDAPAGPLKIRNVKLPKASLWIKQENTTADVDSCSLWGRGHYTPLISQAFVSNNERTITTAYRFHRSAAPLEITSTCLWRGGRSNHVKPAAALWQSHKHTGVWSLNGATKTLEEIVKEQKLQGIKLWARVDIRTRACAHPVTDGPAMRKKARAKAMGVSSDIPVRVSGELWRLNFAPSQQRASLWQKRSPCWRVRSEERSYLWAKHTASRKSTALPAALHANSHDDVAIAGTKRRSRISEETALEFGQSRGAALLWEKKRPESTRQLWQMPVPTKAEAWSWLLMKHKQTISTRATLWTQPQSVSPTVNHNNNSNNNNGTLLNLNSTPPCPIRKSGSRRCTAPLPLVTLDSASLWSAYNNHRDYNYSGNYKAPLQLSSRRPALWSRSLVTSSFVANGTTHTHTHAHTHAHAALKKKKNEKSALVVPVLMVGEEKQDRLIADTSIVYTTIPPLFVNYTTTTINIAFAIATTDTTPAAGTAPLALDSVEKNYLDPAARISDAPPPPPPFPSHMPRFSSSSLNLGEGQLLASSSTTAPAAATFSTATSSLLTTTATATTTIITTTTPTTTSSTTTVQFVSSASASMASTQFLWHPVQQQASLTVQESDTAISLWSKERASRTTTKRPERLNLKKFLSGDKPVEQVHGPLWLPAVPEKLISSPTFSNLSEITRATTPEIEIEQEEKSWLWQKTFIPNVSSMTDEDIQQPMLWAKSTASRVTSSLPISSNSPRMFVSDAPLARVSGSLWCKEKLELATPRLWAKPEFYWRLPEIPAKAPLWSRATAGRTTSLAPQPLTRYAVRQNNAPVAVVSGSLWSGLSLSLSSVDSVLEHRRGAGVDWLARSTCRRDCDARVASLLDAEVVLPPVVELAAKCNNNNKQSAGNLLWCRDTAERTTTLVPERIVDAKVKKSDKPLEKVTGRLWNVQDVESVKKAERVRLWVRPVEKWRMVSLGEIEKVKNAKMWVKETAKRTTDKTPERVVPKPRPAEEVVVSFTGGLWAAPAPKEKQMLWQRQIKTVGSYGFPLQKAPMWQKETAQRTTKLVPGRLMLKPKAKVEIELAKVSGPMWGVKSPGRTHPRSLWQKAPQNKVIPVSSFLWAKENASRTTSATPIKFAAAPRPSTEPLIKATGSLWTKDRNTIVKVEPVALWKAKMKPTGLWHIDRITPTLSQLAEARSACLWLKTPVHRPDTFTTDRSPLPAGKAPKSDKLPAVVGSLWEPRILTTTISPMHATNNSLWGSQQIVTLRTRSSTFASDSGSLPSPSLSSVSTLDDDISTISPISDGNMAAEVDHALLIRSETNTSVAEGLWRRREAEVQAAVKMDEVKSLWNTAMVAPVEREVRKNKVLVLEKPPMGGKKKKKNTAPMNNASVLHDLTMKNLRELAESEEAMAVFDAKKSLTSSSSTSLWRHPSPMMERMFLSLSTTIRKPEQPQSQSQPSSPLPHQQQPSSATKEEKEKHNPFSTMLRIPSLRKHLKPVTSPVHAHAHDSPSYIAERGQQQSQGTMGPGEEGRKDPPALAMPGAEWLRRKGVVG